MKLQGASSESVCRKITLARMRTPVERLGKGVGRRKVCSIIDESCLAQAERDPTLCQVLSEG